MPSFRSAFPSKYLTVADLNGRPLVVTIATAELEAVGDGDKYVARFTDDHIKPFPLNLTNSESVAEVAGSDDVLDWPAHQIELYPTTTLFQGRRVACIRVRAPRLAKPARPAGGGMAPAPAPRPAGKSAPAADDIDEAMPTVGEREY